MIAWLRARLRHWLLDDPSELCFKDFVYGQVGDVPITAQCRRPAGHFGPCDM